MATLAIHSRFHFSKKLKNDEKAEMTLVTTTDIAKGTSNVKLMVNMAA